MSRSDLMKWPLLWALKPEFVTNIHLAFVFGEPGKEESLIVTKDDMVYALGSNTNGCLGIGNSNSTRNLKEVGDLCRKGVTTFAYSRGPYVLALTNNGEVYSWGYNERCQSGNENSMSRLIPSIVCLHPDGKVVVDIACGTFHSLALTDEGEVFAWGANGSGEVCEVGKIVSKPTKVNSALAGKQVVSIACGYSFSMAVTDCGEVYSWGCDSFGQRGLGREDRKYGPSKVAALDSIVIVKVVCGTSHTLVLSDIGVLYVWGGNSHGQLGLGHTKCKSSPVKVSLAQNERVYDIAASHSNDISVAMGHGSRIYVWGECRGEIITEPMLTGLAHPHDAFAFYASNRVMHQPLVLHAEQETSILDCLKNAFDDPSTSDLVIEVQGKPIHVHKSVLKIRCQHFRSMFQEHWAENSQNILKLDQYSHEVYKSFLRYLYTNEVVLPAESAFELFDLANAYFESHLKIRCAQLIKHGITVQNAARLYNKAIEYNLKELEEYFFKFALNHFTAFVQTTNFAELDESTRHTFVIKAAEAGLFKT